MAFEEKIKPLGNRILVKRAKMVASQGGILLPDSAQEKPKEGQVLAIGPGKTEENGTLVPMELSVGDRVLFGAFAGTKVESKEEDEYLVMSEEDVLAVIN